MRWAFDHRLLMCSIEMPSCGVHPPQSTAAQDAEEGEDSHTVTDTSVCV
jgi:hypothetical protein